MPPAPIHSTMLFFSSTTTIASTANSSTSRTRYGCGSVQTHPDDVPMRTYSSSDDLTATSTISMPRSRDGDKNSRKSEQDSIPEQRFSIESVIPTSTLPRDGDAMAWLQCFNAFILMFNSWGLINSYGVWQTYYLIEGLPLESSSNLSWIGSLQTFLIMFGGIATGPLFDKGYLRPLIVTGTVFLVLGIMLTSICHEYWQFVLAQGLLFGLGCACMFTPSVAIVSRNFERQRSLALGMASTGSGIGGIIYPIVFDQLLPKVGFGWTCRIIGFMVLATMLIPVCTIRWRGEKVPSVKGFDAAAWKFPAYSLFAASAFLGFIGIYIPFYYIEFFALERFIIDPALLGYIVTFLNTGSFFGRLIPPYLADRYNTLTVAVVCGFCLAVIGTCWIAVTNQAAVIAFCIIFGFFSGSFVALGPAVVASLTTDMRYFGVRVGMLLVPASLGTLIGNPIAGAILNHGWLALQLFCGIVLIASWFCSSGSKVYIFATGQRSIP